MDKLLKILLLEDSPSDADLIQDNLKKGGLNYDIKTVNTREDFIENLAVYNPEVILSDHSIAQFNSFEALKMVKEYNLRVPFILVTGSDSEELAIKIIQEGAMDYILKDRMARLPAAILNALEKCRLEYERQKFLQQIIDKEAMLREAEHLAEIGSFQLNLITNEVKWSEELYRVLGYNVNEVEPSFEKFLNRVHPEDADFVKTTIENSLKTFDTSAINFKIISDEKNIKYIQSKLLIKRDDQKNPIMLIGFNQNITKEKSVEMEREKILKDIIQRNKNLEQFVYIVSHNLRAPVANILGYSEILKDDYYSEADKFDMISGISASVLKLDDVIKDLNQILQVRTNIHEYNEKIVFSELVENIKYSILSLFERTQVEVETDFSEINETSSIRSYFYSIFYNLITNSIKYRNTNVPLVINIKSKNHKDRFELIFTDNGVGIDLEKNRENIFGLYKRFHPEVEGKGMGLFMVKAQVESLGGKIHVQSRINEGTKFIIEFEK